jgi:WD40 repeat protein
MHTREMASFGLSAEILSNQMSATAQNRQWHLTLTNRFISPFYPDNHFAPTRSFELCVPSDGPITGICVNPLDCDELALACGSVLSVHLRDCVQSMSTGINKSNGFESPLSNLLPFTDASTRSITHFFRKRPFFPRWQPPRGYHNNARITCVAAHPTRPYFVSGDDSGELSLWAFGQRPKDPESGVQYVDAPVAGVAFNSTGDRLLMTTSTGFIFVSDTASAGLLASIAGSRAAWLNADAQIVVAEPRYSKLVVYDLVAGAAPVATFDFRKHSEWAALAVSGSQVISGYDDGSVVLLDIISGQYQTLDLHQSPVRAITYDVSGRFFLTGARENCVRIVNAKWDAEIENVEPVFGCYDENIEPRGVLAIAAGKQTIAAGGFSGNLRIWHASNPLHLLV